jgi:hypothetical protein
MDKLSLSALRGTPSIEVDDEDEKVVRAVERREASAAPAVWWYATTTRTDPAGWPGSA